MNEPFFQGHFPGAPIMPGVLIIEAMAQAGAVLLLHDMEDRESKLVYFTGIDHARFRRTVVPGDQLRFTLEVLKLRSRTCKMQGPSGGRRPARRRGRDPFRAGRQGILTMADRLEIDPRAVVHPDARIGDGSFDRPVLRDRSRRGDRRELPAGSRTSSVPGPVEMGDDNIVSPMASIGGPPQDLKYDGEPTRLVVGRGNRIREFVTMNRGTTGGGGVTRIGDEQPVHGLHPRGARLAGRQQDDLRQRATLAGHVEVGDDATVGAFSGVHQFCRVARHAFIGGYSVVTQDALPWVMTVGQPRQELTG